MKNSFLAEWRWRGENAQRLRQQIIDYKESGNPQIAFETSTQWDSDVNSSLGDVWKFFPEDEGATSIVSLALILMEAGEVDRHPCYLFRQGGLGGLHHLFSSVTAAIEKCADELQIDLGKVAFSCFRATCTLGWSYMFPRELIEAIEAGVSPISGELMSVNHLCDYFIQRCEDNILINLMLQIESERKDESISDLRSECRIGHLQHFLALKRPNALLAYLKQIKEKKEVCNAVEWSYILPFSRDFDEWAIDYASRTRPEEESRIFELLGIHHAKTYSKLAAEKIIASKVPLRTHTLTVALRHFPDETAELFLRALCLPEDERPYFSPESRSLLFREAILRWESCGRKLIEALTEIRDDYNGYGQINGRYHSHASLAIVELSDFVEESTDFNLSDWALACSVLIGDLNEREDLEAFLYFWRIAIESCAKHLIPALWELLRHRHPSVRRLAVQGLVTARAENVVDTCRDLFASTDNDARCGAAELLRSQGREGVDLLITQMAKATPVAVSAEITESLLQLQDLLSDSQRSTIADALIRKGLKKKNPMLPNLGWLPDELFSVESRKGLTREVLALLAQIQSKFKGAGVAPEARLMVPPHAATQADHIGKHLLDKWTSSDQVPKDKWLLTLACYFAEVKLISDVCDHIDDLVVAKRGKMVEHALSCLALIGDTDGLSALAALTGKYTGKQRTAGKAQELALQTALSQRGMSQDELYRIQVAARLNTMQAAMDFAEHGYRLTLEDDCKLSWLHLESRKASKVTPKDLSSSATEQLKTVKILLKQAVGLCEKRIKRAFLRKRAWKYHEWLKWMKETSLNPYVARGLVFTLFDNRGQIAFRFMLSKSFTPRDLISQVSDLKLNAKKLFVRYSSFEAISTTERERWRQKSTKAGKKPLFDQFTTPPEAFEETHDRMTALKSTQHVEVRHRHLTAAFERCGWTRGELYADQMIPHYFKEYPDFGIEAVFILKSANVSSARISRGVSVDFGATLETAVFSRTSPSLSKASSFRWFQENSPNCLPAKDVPFTIYSDVLTTITLHEEN